MLTRLYYRWRRLQCLFKGHDTHNLSTFDIDYEACMRCAKLTRTER